MANPTDPSGSGSPGNYAIAAPALISGQTGGVTSISQFSEVKKRFSRRGPWVLDQVDLDIRSGSRTLIVGGNGSGKSTLLRVAAGVTHPTAGNVVTPDAIGYVPERLAGRSKLTGAEYVAHMGRIKGLDSETVHARSRELFERLNLQPGPTVMTDQLSKGNRQKVVLAQALLAPVGLLVLDEPFSGLDSTAHGALHELLNEAQATGTAVLISAHRAETVHHADVLLHIGDGRLNALANPPTESPSLDDGNQRIELVAAAGASTPEQVADLPGVRSIQHDALVMTLSLDVAHDHTDAILSAVISMGWSVISVSPPGHERN